MHTIAGKQFHHFIVAVMFAALGTVAIFGAASTPAQAKISCNGPWQKIAGVGYKATPYCETQYLAGVARASGISATGRQLRANPNYMAEVCGVVGGNIRVASICSSLGANLIDD